ncbi:MAG: hypothetical protein ACKVWV_02085 [Planctomycetota bacterium]
MPAEFVPAFDALQAALDASEDKAARAILNRIYLRRPKGAALDLAQRFDRVIAGRECARGLDLALDCRGPTAVDGEERWQLVLVARSKLARALRLRPGPASVSIQRASVDARGGEERGLETRSLGQLADIDVPARGASEVELFAFRMPPLQSALCVRSTFALDLRSGVFELDGRELPAQSVRVRSSEAHTLAPALARAGAASSEELTTLVRAGRVPGLRALELVLRLPPEQRAGALDALTPIVAGLAEADVRELVPALRWLGDTVEPGGDPDAWRAWLAQRAHAAVARPPRLSLPPPERSTDEGALAGPHGVRQDERDESGTRLEREHR